MKNQPIPDFLSVAAAGKVLGVSRNAAYQAAREYRDTNGAEGIPNLKVGGRILVPAEALRRMATLPLPGDLT